MVRIGADWRRVCQVGGLAVGLFVAVSVLAAGEAPPSAGAAGGANEGLVDAAVHLIKLGQFDEAAAMLKQVMATSPTPAEALRLRNRAGYDFWAPLMSHAQLGGPVRDLLRLAYEAIQANRTDPAHIAEMVDLLGTAQDPRAVSHLRSCGPYAIPALIQVLGDPQREDKHQAVRTLLTQMPAEAAPAIVEALRCPDVGVQAALADALGQMHSRLALSELKRLAEDPRLGPTVRVHVEEALRTILGRKAWGARPAVEYYLELVLALHQGEDWALPPGVSETLAVWTWDDKAARLTSVEVPRTQYGPLVAERTAERLVTYWPKYEPGYPAWYLAKLGKLWEAEARPGTLKAEDIAGEVRLLGSLLGERRLMAGCEAALQRKDYRAAQGFLRGLQPVAGARAVRVEPAVARALTAPDRAVRYEAALVLVAADPRAPFPGSELAVPVLAEALNQVATLEIVVAAADLDVGTRFRSALRDAGFVVRDVRTSGEALNLVAEAPAVELVMVHTGLTDPDAGEFLRRVRGVRRTRELPVLLVAQSAGERAGLEVGLASRHGHVGVVLETAAPETVQQRVTEAITKARGRLLSAQQARDFSSRAAQALLSIETSHPVFRLPLAAPQARAALLSGPEELRVSACGLLARVGDAPSQQALAQAALHQENSPAVLRAALQGLLDAVRRHGSALEDQQVVALVGLLDRGDPVVTDLTTRLIGMTGVKAQDVAATYRRAGGQ